MRLLLLTLACSLTAFAQIEVGPALPQAHAHNDYEHARPLLDALAQGFTSVEADVYLIEGKLLVGHNREDLKADRTLSALYLDLLKELAAGRNSIFDHDQTLTLLIDFKTEAQATYDALRLVLGNYREMLTAFENGQTKTNAVTVIISGNRPRETLLSEKSRFAAYDGRLSDLGKRNIPVSFMPLVSDNWTAHFTWKGDGPFPADQREKLKSLVTQTHTENRKLRFWGAPDTEPAWNELRDAGVDLINTDNLIGLAKFLRKSPSPAVRQ
jgi:hypothetical protein